MESILHSLGIEWKLLIAQMINFGILAFVLFKLIYKPLLKTLDAREKMVREAQEKSTSIDSKLEEIKKLEAASLAEARLQGEKIIKDVEDKARELKSKLESDAHSSALQIIKDAEARILADAQKRDETIRKEISSVIADAIEKTVGKYLDSDAHKKLGEEATKEALKVSSFVK